MARHKPPEKPVKPAKRPAKPAPHPNHEQEIHLDADRWSGFRDSFGEREVGIDAEGNSIELLRLIKEFSPVEQELVERVARLKSFDRPAIARPMHVEQDDQKRRARVVLVSERIPGLRLSELLTRGVGRSVVPDIGAALFVMRRLFAAAESLRAGTGVFHFVVAPERVVITPRAEVVIVEAALAGAVEALVASHSWPKALRLANADGDVQKDGHRLDIARIARIGIAMMLGRALDAGETVDALSSVLSEIADVGAIRAGDAFSAAFGGWIEHAVTIDADVSFANFREAGIALGRVATPKDCAASRETLRTFLNDLALDDFNSADTVALETDRIRAIRARQTATRPVSRSRAAWEGMAKELGLPHKDEILQESPDEIAAKPKSLLGSVAKQFGFVIKPEPVQASPPPVIEDQPTPAWQAPAEIVAEPEETPLPVVEIVEEPMLIDMSAAGDGMTDESGAIDLSASVADIAEESGVIDLSVTELSAQAPFQEPVPVVEEAPALERPPVYDPYSFDAMPAPVVDETQEEVEVAQVAEPVAEITETHAFEILRGPAAFEAVAPRPSRTFEEPAMPEPVFEEPAPAAAETASEWTPIEPLIEPAVEAAPVFLSVPIVDVPPPIAEPVAEPIEVDVPKKKKKSWFRFGRRDVEKEEATQVPEPVEVEPAPAPAPVYDEPAIAQPVERPKVFEPAAQIFAEPVAAPSVFQTPTIPAPPVKAPEPPAWTPPVERPAPPVWTPPAEAVAAAPAQPVAQAAPLEIVGEEEEEFEDEEPTETASPEERTTWIKSVADELGLKPPPREEMIPELPGPVSEASWQAPTPPATPAWQVRLSAPSAPAAPVGRAEPSQPSPATRPAWQAPPVPPPITAAPANWQPPPGSRPITAAPSNWQPPPPIPGAPGASAWQEQADAPRARPAKKPASQLPQVLGAASQLMRSAALLVLAAGLIGGLAWFGRSYYQQKTAPGTVVIESNPRGAEIFVDGASKGVTPLTIELPAGAHELELRRRGGSRKLTLQITAGEQLKQQIDLTNLRATGTLRVNSNPRGARVLVDGKALGVTPLTVPDVAAGAHKVSIEASSGTVTKDVQVTGGGTTNVDEGIFSGWIAVFAPFPLQVFDKRKLVGTTENERIMLSPGRHDLELVNEQLGFRETRPVDVKPGDTVAVNVTSAEGTLRITAPAGSEVFIDGARVGEAPLDEQKVSVGTREIVVKHPQLGEKKVTARVGSDKPAEITVTFDQP